MIGFQMDFIMMFAISYALAMSSTALAVLLGCSVEDPKLGQEMLPILFVPQMLFAGFFVAPELIPAWLRWARYLCSLTYALRIAMVEEFYDCNPGNPEENRACNNQVEVIDGDPDETWWNWLVLVALFVFFRLVAFQDCIDLVGIALVVFHELRGLVIRKLQFIYSIDRV